MSSSSSFIRDQISFIQVFIEINRIKNFNPFLKNRCNFSFGNISREVSHKDFEKNCNVEKTFRFSVINFKYKTYLTYSNNASQWPLIATNHAAMILFFIVAFSWGFFPIKLFHLLLIIWDFFERRDFSLVFLPWLIFNRTFVYRSFFEVPF